MFIKVNEMNNFNSYGKFAKFLHWAIALLIIWNFIEGLYLESNGLYNFHKQTGVAILILVMVRIFWRVTNNYPKMVASLSKGEKFLAKAGHWLLYLLMLAMPLSGILMSDAFGMPVPFLGLTLPTLIVAQPFESAKIFAK